MRIAVDARPLCVPTFGIGRYLQALMDRFIAEEDIEWFLYGDRPFVRTYHHERVTARASRATNHALSLYRTQVEFARLASRDEVDLFFSPRHHLPLMLPASIPAVVTIHDLVWKRCPETMLLRNRLVEQCLMPPSLRRASAVIAVSSATRDDLVRDYPAVADRITVIHEAADRVEVEAAAASTAAPYFVFLGTLEPRKNLPRLIQAFARARSSLPPEYRLRILGAQGWNTSIDALTRASGCEAVVDVLGHVDDRALHEQLAGAVALCLPSLYEGFGLPALEAMQHGTPVIGANLSSVPEVVGDGGLLVDPLDVPALADAMVRLAREDGLRKTLSAKAREQWQRFSWDRAAAETLALFRRVVDDA